MSGTWRHTVSCSEITIAPSEPIRALRASVRMLKVKVHENANTHTDVPVHWVVPPSVRCPSVTVFVVCVLPLAVITSVFVQL